MIKIPASRPFVFIPLDHPPLRVKQFFQFPGWWLALHIRERNTMSHESRRVPSTRRSMLSSLSRGGIVCARHLHFNGIAFCLHQRQARFQVACGVCLQMISGMIHIGDAIGKISLNSWSIHEDYELFTAWHSPDEEARECGMSLEIIEQSWLTKQFIKLKSDFWQRPVAEMR